MSSHGRDPSTFSVRAVIAHHRNLGEEPDQILEWFRRERPGTDIGLVMDQMQEAEHAHELAMLYKDLPDESILADIFAFGGAPSITFEIRFNVRVQDASGAWEWRPVIVQAHSGMTKAQLREQALADGRELAQKGVGLGGAVAKGVEGEEAFQVSGIFVD